MTEAIAETPAGLSAPAADLFVRFARGAVGRRTPSGVWRVSWYDPAGHMDSTTANAAQVAELVAAGLVGQDVDRHGVTIGATERGRRLSAGVAAAEGGVLR